MKGELIYLKLFEIGRSVNLEAAQKILMSTRVKYKFKKKKGTPDYVNLPSPLVLELESVIDFDVKYVDSAILMCKIYQDGVISIIARLNYKDTEMNQLHLLPDCIIKSRFGDLGLEKWLDLHFDSLHKLIEKTISSGMYKLDPIETEQYSVWTIHDSFDNPYDFLKNNGNYFSTLLMDEDPNLLLHQSQIDITLKNPFSFLVNDVSIFDLDRTIIIDPEKDYEDILLIIELGIYQLLELRVLDEICTQRLDIVESDLRFAFNDNKTLRQLKKKLRDLMPFHYDLIFILENIENVSKIIGDYYLGKQYEHFCNILELNKWSRSVRSHIDWLEQIFTVARSELNEKIMLILEAGLGIIFTLEFILFVLTL